MTYRTQEVPPGEQRMPIALCSFSRDCI